MDTKKLRANLLVMVALGVVFLIGAPGVQAAMMKNWTETEYTVSSGNLDFDWDKNSKDDLSFSQPYVVDRQMGETYHNQGGTLYMFAIPNFYDPLPKKTVDISMLGGNRRARGLELARVIGVLGSDSLYGDENAPALPTPGQLVDRTFRRKQVTELWHIFPNPDFETVTIWAPDKFELERIKIATQSVPLPSSILLLGSALLGLVVLKRRS